LPKVYERFIRIHRKAAETYGSEETQKLVDRLNAAVLSKHGTQSEDQQEPEE